MLEVLYDMYDQYRGLHMLFGLVGVYHGTALK